MVEVRNLSCQIPLQDYRGLRDLARRQDRSMSWLVRRGIRHVLSETEAATAANGDGLEKREQGAIRGPA
jgi:predicted transcriptional regulator